MISSIIKSSSIKFSYDGSEDNYWQFVVDQSSPIETENCRLLVDKLRLELKIPLPDIGIVTQQYDVDERMIRELIEWFIALDNTVER